MQAERLGKESLQAGEIILNYLNISDPLESVDAIFLFGSRRIESPRHAASLYNQGLASTIFCFAKGENTFEESGHTEAEHFALEMKSLGVSETDIVAIPQADNTLEEAVMFKKFLENKSKKVSSLILVTHPYHQRRAWATFRKHFPEIKLINSPSDVNYEINQYRLFRYAGEIRRLQEYAEKGDIELQEIPENVLESAQFIVEKFKT